MNHHSLFQATYALHEKKNQCDDHAHEDVRALGHFLVHRVYYGMQARCMVLLGHDV